MQQGSSLPLTSHLLWNDRAEARAAAAKLTGLENVNGSIETVMSKTNEQSWLHFYR
jgi:hypothetical protein